MHATIEPLTMQPLPRSIGAVEYTQIFITPYQMEAEEDALTQTLERRLELVRQDSGCLICMLIYLASATGYISIQT